MLQPVYISGYSQEYTPAVLRNKVRECPFSLIIRREAADDLVKVTKVLREI